MRPDRERKNTSILPEILSPYNSQPFLGVLQVVKVVSLVAYMNEQLINMGSESKTNCWEKIFYFLCNTRYLLSAIFYVLSFPK